MPNPLKINPLALNALQMTGISTVDFVNVEITDEYLVIAGEHGDKCTLEAATIVLVGGMKPNTELLEALQDTLPEVYAIGDCVKPRLVLHAI